MKNCTSNWLICFWNLSSIVWMGIHCGDYLGCFEDSSQDVILKKKKTTDIDLTIQRCFNFCRENEYIYAGLRDGTLCLCDFELRTNISVIRLSDMECDTECAGNNNTYCGGVFKTALYIIDLTLDTSEVITTHPLNTTIFPISETTDHLTIQSKSESTSIITLEYITQNVMTNSEQSSMTTTGSVQSSITTDSAQSTITSLQLSTENMSMHTTISSTLTGTKQHNITTLDSNSSCYCPCIDTKSLEFQGKLQFLVQNITIDRKRTSMYKRSKISVYESRISSTTIGIIGIVFISLIICLIIAADIHTCCNRKQKYEIRHRD